VGNLGLDDAPAAGGGHRQGLFAEHRLAGGDGRQHELFVARAPGRHQQRLDLRRLDQGMAVGVDLGLKREPGQHPGRLLRVDVGYRHHPAALQGLAATPNVILTYGTSADNA